MKARQGVNTFKRKSSQQAEKDLDSLDKVVPSSGINPLSSLKRNPYRIAKFWDDNFWKVLAVGALFLAVTGLIGAFFPPALAVFIPAANFAATHGALGFFAVTALSMIGAGITKFFAGLFCRKTEKKAGRAAERILPEIKRGVDQKEEQIAQKKGVAQKLDKEKLDIHSQIDELNKKISDNESKIATKQTRLNFIAASDRTNGSLAWINANLPSAAVLPFGVIGESQYLTSILNLYKGDDRWRGESSAAFKIAMDAEVAARVAVTLRVGGSKLNLANERKDSAQRRYDLALAAVLPPVVAPPVTDNALKVLKDDLDNANAAFNVEMGKVENQQKINYLQTNSIVEPYKKTHQEIYNLLEECVSKNLSAQEKFEKVSQIKILSDSLPMVGGVNDSFMSSADIDAINNRFKWNNDTKVKQRDEMVKEQDTLRKEISSLQVDNLKHRNEKNSLDTKIRSIDSLSANNEVEIDQLVDQQIGLRGVKDNFEQLINVGSVAQNQV